jgi:5-methyltetrahydrofolate--homocysteine methyltransferase
MTQAERVKALRELFAQRIVVLDGAMGTMIQKQRLDEAAYRGERYASWHRDLKGCNDLLVLTRPQVIADIHREFIDAGADLISTNRWARPGATSSGRCRRSS